MRPTDGQIEGEIVAEEFVPIIINTLNCGKSSIVHVTMQSIGLLECIRQLEEHGNRWPILSLRDQVSGIALLREVGEVNRGASCGGVVCVGLPVRFLLLTHRER